MVFCLVLQTNRQAMLPFRCQLGLSNPILDLMETITISGGPGTFDFPRGVRSPLAASE